MDMENMNYEGVAKALLRENADLVESLLNSFYRGGGRCDAALDEACRYSLLAGGKLIKELGDVAWYLAETAYALDISLDEVCARNIEKLRRRFPEGFSKEKSIHRAE